MVRILKKIKWNAGERINNFTTICESLLSVKQTQVYVSLLSVWMNLTVKNMHMSHFLPKNFALKRWAVLRTLKIKFFLRTIRQKNKHKLLPQAAKHFILFLYIHIKYIIFVLFYFLFYTCIWLYSVLFCLCITVTLGLLFCCCCCGTNH